MDDAPFVPHPPGVRSPPPVIVQPAHPRHSRTFTISHLDGRSPRSGTPTQASFHQHPPVRPISVSAPPGGHFPALPFSVSPSPTLAHPPPHNIINVGTPAPVAPVVPLPDQLQGPSPKPIVTHLPSMVGTVPMPVSPFAVPHKYTRSHGPSLETVDPLQDENQAWREVMGFFPGGDLYAAIKKGTCH